MTTKKEGRVVASLVAFGVVLAAAVPVARALQPEPRMMFETGPGMGVAQVAQEPALRAQTKELRGAQEPLRRLAMTDCYDEVRARQIAAQAAQAGGEVDVTHARRPHAAFTPTYREQRGELRAEQGAEQRAERREQLNQCKAGNDGGPPPERLAPPR